LGLVRAVKPCASGAPLVRLRGLTTRPARAQGLPCRNEAARGHARRTRRHSIRHCPIGQILTFTPLLGWPLSDVRRQGSPDSDILAAVERRFLLAARAGGSLRPHPGRGGRRSHPEGPCRDPLASPLIRVVDQVVQGGTTCANANCLGRQSADPEEGVAALKPVRAWLSYTAGSIPLQDTFSMALYRRRGQDSLERQSNQRDPSAGVGSVSGAHDGCTLYFHPQSKS